MHGSFNTRKDSVAPHGPVPCAAHLHPAATGVGRDDMLALVARHVAANLDGRIAIADLAMLCGFSQGHFCREFRARYGVTAHGFVIRMRIAHAQKLMVETAEPICAIAYACGLSDQAHLTRLFKRIVGETPSAWRRRQMLPAQAPQVAVP